MKVLYRVITCDTKGERYVRFKKTADEINLKVSVLKCTNGKNMTPKKLYEYVEKGYLDPKAHITAVEFAIYMSHMRCWEQLIKSKSEYMVIFEDDIEIKKNFKSVLDDILKEEFGVFFMANGNYIPVKNTRRRVSTIQYFPVFRQTQYHIPGTSCYCIHRNYAEKLLTKAGGVPHRIKEPVDNFIGGYLLKTFPQLTFNSIEYDQKTNKKITANSRSDNGWPYLDSPSVYTNRKIGNNIDISTNDWSLPSVNVMIRTHHSSQKRSV